MANGRRMKLAVRLIVFAGLLAGLWPGGKSRNAVQASGQTSIAQVSSAEVSGGQSSSGQIGSGQHQNTNGMPGPANPDLDSQPSPFRDSARQRMNAERQRKLVGDTQRLLALANQLKAEAAVAGTESLTPEMLHQMDEIEKLARSVKDKMRS